MRVLLLSAVSPYPPNRGGSQRVNLIYRALREIADVDLVVAEPGTSEVNDGLRERFNLVGHFTLQQPGERFPVNLLHRFQPKLANQLVLSILPKSLEYRPDLIVSKQVGNLIAVNKYDLIVTRHLRLALKCGCPDSIPNILDLDDVDSHIYRSRYSDSSLPYWERLINWWSYKQVEKLQPTLLRQFDCVWLAHDQHTDLNYLRQALCLPNIAFSEKNHLPPVLPEAQSACERRPPVLLFVGVHDYPPNVAAVDHFISSIWPVVRRAEPEARFRIVGSRMTAQQRVRWGAVMGVEPVGFVEDITTAYADCCITVVPIMTGSGTNIKVIESLAYGRACVASKFAHIPFAGVLKDGVSLRVADTDEKFALACIELIRDPNLRAALAAGGRGMIEQHFSFDAFQKIVAKSVERVLSSRNTHHSGSSEEKHSVAQKLSGPLSR